METKTSVEDADVINRNDFINEPATTKNYTGENTLSLHDALPILQANR